MWNYTIKKLIGSASLDIGVNLAKELSSKYYSETKDVTQVLCMGDKCKIMKNNIVPATKNALNNSYTKKVCGFIKKHSVLTTVIAAEIIWTLIQGNELTKQRIINMIKLLSDILNKLKEDPRDIMNNNLFVAAVDIRDFYSFNPLTILRRDDGAWCNFVKVNAELPIALESGRSDDDARRFYNAIRIINEITRELKIKHWR